MHALGLGQALAPTTRRLTKPIIDKATKEKHRKQFQTLYGCYLLNKYTNNPSPNYKAAT